MCISNFKSVECFHITGLLIKAVFCDIFLTNNKNDRPVDQYLTVFLYTRNIIDKIIKF